MMLELIELLIFHKDRLYIHTSVFKGLTSLQYTAFLAALAPQSMLGCVIMCGYDT